MAERSILHCDMNHFYASVERLYDRSLFGVPMAVCGDESLRHGIVLAKSDEAKKCGVKTGDAIWQAKEKCPEIRIVLPHFERYTKYSRLAKAIYLEYTDLVEPFGLDECWLDVSASRLAFGSGVQIGEEIRGRIKKELGLTISVGVSFNKVFAKLGSDLKKPDALTAITKENFREVVWPLPVEDLLGVGPKTASRLHFFGIDTIDALAHANSDFLKLLFGKIGPDLKQNALGGDLSPVLPSDLEPPMKSVGHGITVPADLKKEEEVWNLIFLLSQEIGEKLRFYSKKANGIAIECKDKNFFTKSFQRRLFRPTDCTMTLAKEAFLLFREKYRFSEPIRAITVRAIDLEKTEAEQLSIFLKKEVLRGEVLDRAGDAIRERFGKGAILPASLMNSSLPDHDGYVPFH